jgi:NAD(P)-dependent dehydrogenase (short-subunit alcohol dehydrogenase family)
MKVKDKVFVVTGGGNGIGRELALGLIARGARVAAADVNKTAMEKTLELSGNNERLAIYTLDITDKDAVEAFPGEVVSRHGAIDGVINNAGVIQPFVGLDEIGYDTVKRIMDVNFYGTLYMTKAFLPYLKLRPESHITNISSMGGFFPVPGQTVYGASKAGVRLMTEGLCFELRGMNIKVMVVFPGGIGSDIMSNSGVKISARMERIQKIIRLTTPKKAARIIINGIEHNRSRLAVGFDAALMDAVCRISPLRAERLLYRLMEYVLYD